MPFLEYDPNEAVETESTEEEVPTGEEQEAEFAEGTEPETEEELSDEEKFKVTLQDDDGNEMVEEYSPQELARMVQLAKTKGDPNVGEFVENIKPIVETIKNSEVLQMVLHYKSQGYSDEQIAQHLPGVWNQVHGVSPKAAEVEEAEPEFDTIDDRVNWLVEKKLSKVLKDKLEPVVNAQQRSQEEQALQKIIRANDAVFERALNSKFGISMADLSDEDRGAVVDSYFALYPGVPIERNPLSDKQSIIIIKDALGRKYGRKNNNGKAAQLTNKVLPKMVEGKAAKPKVAPIEKKVGLNEMEMANNFLKFINGQ